MSRPKPPGVYIYAGLKARLMYEGSDIQETIDRINGRQSLHCTLMYGKVKNRRTPRFKSESLAGFTSKVIDVRYISHADCTCLILQNSRPIQARHDFYRELGLDLGYAFEPHITVGQGDCTGSVSCVIGCDVDLSDEYLQVIIKD